MKITTSLLLLTSLIISQQSNAICVLDKNVSSAEWFKCANKQVQITGTPPNMIMQHPMLNMPSFSAKTKPTLQSYLNVGSKQIILLSKTRINCFAKMEVFGQLRRISLGGRQGTKNSYKGWSLRVYKYRCFENRSTNDLNSITQTRQ